MAEVLLNPDREHSISGIASRVGSSATNVLREIERLEAAGLVSTRKRGNTRLAHAVTDGPVYGPLVQLLAVTFGPRAVLRDLLIDVDGIERAFIYGSWAARYHEVSGAVPGDIDVLVVGTPNRDALTDAIEAAERSLHREVNVRRVSPQAWAGDDGPFKRTVMSSPIVELVDNRGEVDERRHDREDPMAGR